MTTRYQRVIRNMCQTYHAGCIPVLRKRGLWNVLGLRCSYDDGLWPRGLGHVALRSLLLGSIPKIHLLHKNVCRFGENHQKHVVHNARDTVNDKQTPITRRDRDQEEKQKEDEVAAPQHPKRTKRQKLVHSDNTKKSHCNFRDQYCVHNSNGDGPSDSVHDHTNDEAKRDVCHYHQQTHISPIHDFGVHPLRQVFWHPLPQHHLI
mmetsp:Transcript_30948/g.67929  ORF Transcript_30948/g.67929 Transcript_30948/m.67929 type:complete len:205 (+) Transcript_30948:462-1076(+)